MLFIVCNTRSNYQMRTGWFPLPGFIPPNICARLNSEPGFPIVVAFPLEVIY